MGIIEPKQKVLEDGLEALIEGEAEVVSEGEDLVSFAELNGEDTAVTPVAPVTAKPAVPAAKVAPAAAAAPVAAPAVGEEEVPEEFRGKSKKEIVEMYRNAHSTIGRQGSELAKFRQYADRLLQSGMQTRAAPQAPAAPAAPAEQPLDDAAIFAKPLEAVNKLIENHPLVKEIRAKFGDVEADVAVRRAEASKARFDSAHPDASQILQDPEFRSWVQASPMRSRMLVAADKQYNFEAGDELFGTWKALRKVQRPQDVAVAGQPAAVTDAQPTEAEVKQAATTLARARAMKQANAAAASAASVPTGGSVGAKAGQTANGKGGKIYRRVDLIELQIQNPDRYEAMQDEIQAAYRENRVR